MSERDSAAPVRLVIDNAELLPQPLSEDVDGGGTSYRGGSGLPRDFPITPLGQSVEGDGSRWFYYLDRSGYIQPLLDTKHGRLPLLGLLEGDLALASNAIPAKNKFRAGASLAPTPPATNGKRPECIGRSSRRT